MILVSPEIREALRANDRARQAAQATGQREPDPVPVVRFFNPIGYATWLATEIDEDGIMFGLADLGFGSPSWAALRSRRWSRSGFRSGSASSAISCSGAPSPCRSMPKPRAASARSSSPSVASARQPPP